MVKAFAGGAKGLSSGRKNRITVNCRPEDKTTRQSNKREPEDNCGLEKRMCSV